MATLTRIGSTRVYAGASAPGQRGFLAFLLSNPNAAPPPELSVQQAWDEAEYTGWFTIWPDEPAPLLPFAETLQDSPLFEPPEHTSFGWARYQASTQEITVVNRLPLNGAGAQPAAAADTRFDFRNYGFTIHQDSPVILSGESRFVFEYPPLPGLPPPNTENLSLPFDGAERFCFQSQGFLADFSDSVQTGWDVALRFYSGEPLTYWRYPVFENPAAGVRYLFQMNWDLLAPLDVNRTFLAFTNIAFELTSTEGPDPVWSLNPVPTDGAMQSGFRTLYGAKLKLRPLLAGAVLDTPRLVFEEVPDAERKPERYTYNLVPCGDFQLMLDAQGGSDLLCGLSGTEFIRIDTAGSATVRFHPKQPAYAPVFPLLKTDGGGVSQDLLTNRFTTAWASLGAQSGVAPIYYSQPSDSPLFTTQEQAPESDVLALFNPELAALSLERAFPLAPYGLANSGTTEDLSDFEKQILAPFRHQEVVKSPRPPANALRAAAFVSTTPQGFLAKIEGFKWNEVLLARTKNPAGGDTQLAFRDLLAPLREAFQSSELFLVISRNQNLGEFQNRIMISDWPFIVNLPAESAESFANVLIIKFCEGSVQDRARDAASWTNAPAFNTNPAQTAFGITAYIREAEAQSAEVPALANFLEIVRRPTWNGILALRVDIELSAFPDDLKGLLGGMDLSRFYGHHLGLTLNFVERGQQLEMPADSSLFALINYRDQYGDPGHGRDETAQPAPPPSSDQRLEAPADLSSSFDYRVISMLVEFRNSEVINFESRIILTISKLFGETAALASSSSPQFRNSLVFDGNRQVINLKPSYSFRTREQYRFLLSGTVVKYAQISSAQFITLAQEAGSLSGEPVELVRARFNLSGFLNFYDIPEFDAFSFGDAVPDNNLPVKGLQFANLGIGMEFYLPAAQPLTFSLDPTLMSFDTGLSNARERSLFKKFPVTMSALLAGSADRSVKELGYVPVRVRQLSKLGSIGAEWYGLALILNLGTLGALANNAGFAATLLIAWSPGGPPNPVQVFLNLPGLGTGKKEIGLQSVLKLTLGSLELSTQIDAADQITAYVLSLRNIGLSVLGKKLPTSGVTDLALFSDFRDQGGSSLSWYAAYYTEPPPPALTNPEASTEPAAPQKRSAVPQPGSAKRTRSSKGTRPAKPTKVKR